MRAFRIAVPASRLERSREFYERVLGMAADDTVPTRLYFHCGHRHVGGAVVLLHGSGRAPALLRR